MIVSRGKNNNCNSTDGKSSFYYGWVVLIVCLILITNSYGIRFSFGVFFKSLEQDFGWTRAMTSGIFSVQMLICSLIAILGGWMADRYGAKIVFMIMGFFAFCGLTLTSLANSLWHIFISYSLLVAVGIGPTYPVAVSVATRWFTKRRGLATAIVTSGVGLGSIVMVPITAFFVDSYGWRYSFIIIGIIALCVMITCSLFLKRTPMSANVSSINEDHESIELNYYEVNQKQERTFSIRRVFRTRNLWFFIAILLFYGFCLFTITTHIIPYAIDLGITPIKAASILGVSGFANIPSRIISGMISDRFGRKPVALMCALLMAIAMFWLTRSSSLWMLYTFAIAFGIAYGGLAPPILAMVGDSFGNRHIGFIFGITELGWVSGSALGPALAGYIFDTTGRYYFAFILCIIAAFIMVILILFLTVPKLKYNEVIDEEKQT